MSRWPAESVDLVMFSPPYYGLRDYGTKVEVVWGREFKCEHKWLKSPPRRSRSEKDIKDATSKQATVRGSAFNISGGCFCAICGAWRGQLGLEPSWQLYVKHLTEICREVKRVLKPTGSMYIVLGDTYNAGRSGGHPGGRKGISRPQIAPSQSGVNARDYPAKCLMGIPWRLAFALIDDGWILRNDIIWYKPNHMPLLKSKGES